MLVVNVKVIPKAKQNLIKPLDTKNLKIYVTSPPEKGKANKQAVELLSQYYKVGKNNIEIILGLHSQNKTIKINP